MHTDTSVPWDICLRFSIPKKHRPISVRATVLEGSLNLTKKAVGTGKEEMNGGYDCFVNI